MRSRSLLMTAAVLGLLLGAPATALAGGSVGTPSVYSTTHAAHAGRALAFRSFASASGRVGRLNVYLAPTSSARRVELGLYGNRSGRPSKRLGRCVVTAPQPGTWNSCAMPATTIRQGVAYWMTLLQPRRSKGRLRFGMTRSRPHGDAPLSAPG